MSQEKIGGTLRKGSDLDSVWTWFVESYVSSADPKSISTCRHDHNRCLTEKTIGKAITLR